MAQRLFRIVAACLFLLLALTAGCMDGSSDSNVVHVGALLPMSGNLAATGAVQLPVLQKAVEDVNLHLELDGSPMRFALEAMDTGSTAQGALDAIEDLALKGVRLVVGPSSSTEAQAVRAFAAANGMMLISPSSTSSSLAIAGDNLFRLAPPSDKQANGTAQLLAGDGKTVLLPVWLDDDWAREFKNQVLYYFNGGTRAASLGAEYSADAPTAFLPTLDAEAEGLIDTFGADKVALLLVSFDEGMDIMAEAGKYEHLSQITWYGSESFTNSQELLDNANAAAFAAQVGYTGSIFSLRDDVTRTPRPVLTDICLREGVELETGRGLPDDVFSVYDALWLYYLGLNQNDWSSDPESLKPALLDQASAYAGLMGPLGLDGNGDLKAFNYGFYTVADVGSGPAWVLRASCYRIFNKVYFAYVNASSLPSSANAPATQTVGALLNLSGNGAEAGKAAQAALQEALIAVNNHLEYNGYPTRFALDIRDVSENSALSQLEELNAAGVKVVIGPILSDDCANILGYANANGMLLISPSSTDSYLAIADDPLYRFVSPNSIQSAALAEFSVNEGVRALVPLTRDDSWGASVLNDMQSAMPTAGGVVLTGASYNPTTRSYADSLAALDAQVATALETYDAGQVAVYLISLDDGLDLLALAATYPNLAKVNWYCTDGLATSVGLTTNEAAASFAIARNLAGPIYDIMATHKGSTPTPLPRFIHADKIQARLGSKPSPYAYPAWDGFFCAALAFLQADWSETPVVYAQALRTVTASNLALNGFMALDENGDQMYGHYAFFGLQNSADGPAWRRLATYHFHPNGPSATWFTDD